MSGGATWPIEENTSVWTTAPRRISGSTWAANAAVRKDHVAMTIRVGQAAFVCVKRREDTRHLKKVYQILALPPGELLVETGLVVGDCDVVECRGVDSIPVDFQERAVVLEVLRHIAMPVHIAAIDPILLAAG